MQIIFINIQNLQHKTLSCKLINLFLYKLLLDIQKNDLQDKLTIVSHKSVLSEIKIPTFRFSFTYYNSL
jgi:hypothetical protein